MTRVMGGRRQGDRGGRGGVVGGLEVGGGEAIGGREMLGGASLGVMEDFTCGLYGLECISNWSLGVGRIPMI